MGATAKLLVPPSALGGCLFAGIVRDTRGAELSDQQRYNFFPASPLVMLTQVMIGELRLLPTRDDLVDCAPGAPLPRVFVTPPQDLPIVSWSPGDVLAMTLGFHPEAWVRLSAACDPKALLEAACIASPDAEATWDKFCAMIDPIWQATSPPVWAGTGRIGDWAHALLARAAISGPGRTMRSLERRLRRWGGPTRRALAFYTGVDDLHRIALRSAGRPLAEIALEAGYADQSHMGRALRRATGFSPARLHQLTTQDEAFWCYRLLGERF